MKYYLDLNGIQALDAKYLELFAKKSDLGSAAYADTSAFDVSGAAAEAQENITGTPEDSVDTLTLNGIVNKLNEFIAGNDGRINELIAEAIDLLDIDAPSDIRDSYISSIYQENGKIVVTYEHLHFDEAGSAQQAKEEANNYTDEKVGSIPTGSTTVIDYVDDTKKEIMNSFVPITDDEIDSFFR